MGDSYIELHLNWNNAAVNVTANSRLRLSPSGSRSVRLAAAVFPFIGRLRNLTSISNLNSVTRRLEHQDTETLHYHIRMICKQPAVCVSLLFDFLCNLLQFISSDLLFVEVFSAYRMNISNFWNDPLETHEPYDGTQNLQISSMFAFSNCMPSWNVGELFWINQ